MIGRPSLCGRCGVCERCRHAAYMRRWYRRKSKEEKRKHIAKRDPKQVTYHNDHKMKTRRADQGSRGERQKARDVLSKAVLRGKIVPQTCPCGQKGEAHHEDYSKPLDVRWLCKSCHLAQHGIF